jgi:hypothetical protein
VALQQPSSQLTNSAQKHCAHMQAYGSSLQNIPPPTYDTSLPKIPPVDTQSHSYTPKVLSQTVRQYLALRTSKRMAQQHRGGP